MVQKGKVLGVLLYLGLLACALAFCWQNVLDYLEGNTYYVSTEKKLSLGDLPTVTFCKPRFDTSNDPCSLSDPLNVSIYSRIQKRKTDGYFEPLKTVLLKENKMVQTSFDLHLTLKTLTVNKEYQNNGNPSCLRCFKVSSEWNGIDTESVEVDSLSIEFILEYEKSLAIPVNVITIQSIFLTCHGKAVQGKKSTPFKPWSLQSGSHLRKILMAWTWISGLMEKSIQSKFKMKKAFS